MIKHTPSTSPNGNPSYRRSSSSLFVSRGSELVGYAGPPSRGVDPHAGLSFGSLLIRRNRVFRKIRAHHLRNNRVARARVVNVVRLQVVARTERRRVVGAGREAELWPDVDAFRPGPGAKFMEESTRGRRL